MTDAIPSAAHHLRRSSRLPVSPERAWVHATTMREINRELGPWMKMTYPAELEGLTLDDPRVRLGEPLFTSWVLLLGLLPIERMQLVLVDVVPGRRFVEQSILSTMRFWRHTRSVEPAPAGCTLTDELSFAAPLAAATPLVARGLELFFAHRHRRLAELLA